jgi:hypothetical protein
MLHRTTQWCLFVATLFFGVTSVSLAIELPSRSNAHGVAEVLLDNDEFAGINRRDRWYTSGYRFRKSIPRAKPTRGWEQVAVSLCPGLRTSDATRSFDQWSIGQNIYTQSIRNRLMPLPNDRPIAALLYGTTGSALAASNGHASTTVEVGVIGPAALGQQFQNTWHKILGATQNPAWDYQLRPRLSVVGHLDCLRSGSVGWLGWQAGYGISVGSTLARARSAVAISIGPDKDAINIPIEARFNFAPARHSNSWAVITGFRANWTGYDYLLDGNTYQYESDTRSKRITAEWFAGVSWVFYRDWRVQYVYSRRAVDFEGLNVGQENYQSQAIGMVTISIPF